METPTIVKQTKDYMLVKIPLPKKSSIAPPTVKKDNMTPAEKRLWKIIQEGEGDLREGRVVTAPSITEALRRYDKKRWG